MGGAARLHRPDPLTGTFRAPGCTRARGAPWLALRGRGGRQPGRCSARRSSAASRSSTHSEPPSTTRARTRARAVPRRRGRLGKSRLVREARLPRRGLRDDVPAGSSRAEREPGAVSPARRGPVCRRADGRTARPSRPRAVSSPARSAGAGMAGPGRSRLPTSRPSCSARRCCASCASPVRAPGRFVVLEDLHWADPETLMIVEYLIDNITAEPVVLLVTVARRAGHRSADPRPSPRGATELRGLRVGTALRRRGRADGGRVHRRS